MSSRRATLLQGTLDLLILKALSTGELHGLGVSRRIEQMTGGTFVVQPARCFLHFTGSKKPGGSPRHGTHRTTTGARSTTA